jgi:hypothetical protein
MAGVQTLGERLIDQSSRGTLPPNTITFRCFSPAAA